MRLWSVDPKYLDAKGLVALWREGLLAQKVLRGLTKGYRHHPQLARFRASDDPVAAIATYLAAVVAEAESRGYKFDATKLARGRVTSRLSVTDGQLRYELEHLRAKLKVRDPERLHAIRDLEVPKTHSLFRKRKGDVEAWERP